MCVCASGGVDPSPGGRSSLPGAGCCRRGRPRPALHSGALGDGAVALPSLEPCRPPPPAAAGLGSLTRPRRCCPSAGWVQARRRGGAAAAAAASSRAGAAGSAAPALDPGAAGPAAPSSRHRRSPAGCLLHPAELPRFNKDEDAGGPSTGRVQARQQGARQAGGMAGGGAAALRLTWHGVQQPAIQRTCCCDPEMHRNKGRNTEPAHRPPPPPPLT